MNKKLKKKIWGTVFFAIGFVIFVVPFFWLIYIAIASQP
jgi:membrane protein CcdC involved in cytochrome C biogenesis|tara:strand:+ start:1409 stop:1525 length:117 start_codon:yes stop_codon:yes gene_type:complete